MKWTEQQIEKLANELSEDQLNDLAAGKMDAKTQKVLKWVGIGTATAVGLAGVAVGTAALVGWKTGKGAFGYLHSGDDSISSRNSSDKGSLFGENVIETSDDQDYVTAVFGNR